VAGVVGGLGYGGWRLYDEALTTPRLALKRIIVRGALRAQPRDLIRLAGIREGENIFSFSAAEVAARVEESPWVVSAVVRRKLPDTVRVDVTERRPLAIVKMKDLYVMDTSGEVFKKLGPEDRLDLPLLTGLDKEALKNKEGCVRSLQRLFASLEGSSGLNLENVSEIHYDPVYGFSLYTLDEGLRVELGSTEFERGLRLFERLRAMKGGLGGGVVAVDVRKAGEAVVRYDHEVVPDGGGRA
jgi:cell division protein FtsQ